MTMPAHQLLFPNSCEHWKNHSVSITTLLTYMSNCEKPSKKCKHSPHLMLKGRSDTMITRPMPFHLNQVTWSWWKPMPTKGGERSKTSGRRKCVKWNARLQKATLHISWKTNRPDAHESSIGIDFFSSPLQWELLYAPCMSWADKVCHHHPEGTYSESKWEWESATECKVSATSPASDRWDSCRVDQ